MIENVISNRLLEKKLVKLIIIIMFLYRNNHFILYKNFKYKSFNIILCFK